MTLNFNELRSVVISMKYYVKGIIDSLPSDMAGEAITLTSSHLFDVKKDAFKLPEPQAELFHKLVAKLLFLCKIY